MAIAATEIAWSTPVRVTLRHPLGRGMSGLLLRGGIWVLLGSASDLTVANIVTPDAILPSIRMARPS